MDSDNEWVDVLDATGSDGSDEPWSRSASQPSVAEANGGKGEEATTQPCVASVVDDPPPTAPEDEPLESPGAIEAAVEEQSEAGQVDAQGSAPQPEDIKVEGEPDAQGSAPQAEDAKVEDEPLWLQAAAAGLAEPDSEPEPLTLREYANALVESGKIVGDTLLSPATLPRKPSPAVLLFLFAIGLGFLRLGLEGWLLERRGVARVPRSVRAVPFDETWPPMDDLNHTCRGGGRLAKYGAVTPCELQSPNQETRALLARLRATNYKLHAVENELADTVGKLRASEHELFTNTEQLHAVEEKLAATFGTLQASAHVLTVTTVQLQAAETELAATVGKLQASGHELAASKERLQTSGHELAATKEMLLLSEHELTATKEMLQASGHELAATKEMLLLSEYELASRPVERLTAASLAAPLSLADDSGAAGSGAAFDGEQALMASLMASRFWNELASAAASSAACRSACTSACAAACTAVIPYSAAFDSVASYSAASDSVAAYPDASAAPSHIPGMQAVNASRTSLYKAAGVAGKPCGVLTVRAASNYTEASLGAEWLGEADDDDDDGEADDDDDDDKKVEEVEGSGAEVAWRAPRLSARQLEVQEGLRHSLLVALQNERGSEVARRAERASWKWRLSELEGEVDRLNDELGRCAMALAGKAKRGKAGGGGFKRPGRGHRKRHSADADDETSGATEARERRAKEPRRSDGGHAEGRSLKSRGAEKDARRRGGPKHEAAQKGGGKQKGVHANGGGWPKGGGGWKGGGQNEARRSKPKRGPPTMDSGTSAAAIGSAIGSAAFAAASAFPAWEPWDLW